MYCGNNARDPDVRAGRKAVGTRYQCLKKGIGVGLSLPKDKKYKSRYIPIDTRKIYCGEAAQLPQGYDLLGNSTMCYFKGVGVGRAIKAKRRN